MNFRLPKLMDISFNPIMIKELRQVTRSRFLIGIIFFYILIMLCAVGFFIFSLALAIDGSTWNSGRRLFGMLLPILNISCILFVPIYVGVRLAIEHSDTNMDLLFTTPLKPGEIIRGKLMNGIIITLMLYSICVPFMVFTYLLRGIDIPTIFIVLVPLFLITILIIQTALCIAVIPASKPFKGLLGLAAVGFNLLWIGGSSVLISEIVPSGMAGDIVSWEFWGQFLSVAVIGILIFILLHAFTVALIMPRAANRALPVRVACAIAWLTVGVGLAIWAKVESSSEVLAAWAIPTIIGFSVVFLFAIGEADKIGARIRQNIPRRRFLRPLAFLFYSGGGGGIFFCCLIVLITLIVSFAAACFVSYNASYWPKLLYNFSGFFLYVLAYGFTAILVRRFVFRDRIPSKFTGAIALFLMMLGALLPSVIGMMRIYDDISIDTIGWWQLFNPAGLLDPKFRSNGMTFVSIWAAVMFVVVAPWIFRQAREFMSGGKKPV